MTGGAAGRATAGAGGQAAGGLGGQGGEVSLEEACDQICTAQRKLSCAIEGCNAACADPVAPGSVYPTQCPDEYLAMLQCTRRLESEDWFCSDWGMGGPPVPAPGENTPCETVICGYTCCTDIALADPNLMIRCGCYPDW